jgi:hypothetical protein
MSKHYGIDGVGTIVELGKGGPKVKNSSGVIEARNAADNAYAIVRGASPVGSDDLTTRSFVEAGFKFSDSAPSYGFIPGFLPTLSFSDTTFLVTLTDPTGGWKYDRNGVRCNITGNKSVRLVADPGGNPAPAAGEYFIYIDATDGTLTSSTASWTLEDTKVPCAIVYWNDTLTPKYHLANELHTSAIPRRFHWEHHFADGSEILSGGNISGYVINDAAPAGDTDNTFGIDATVFADEDLKVTLAALTDPNGTDLAYTTITRNSTTTYVWGSSAVPFTYTNAGYINYNTGGTSTQGTTGKFYTSYLLLTNFAGVGRYMVLSGRTEFATYAEACTEDVGLFNWDGFPIAECIIGYRLVWATGSTYTTKGKVRLAGVNGIMLGRRALANRSLDLPIRVLDDILDVKITSAVVDQGLFYDGQYWVNKAGVVSAGLGISFYSDDTTLIDKAVGQSAYSVESLLKTPRTIAEQVQVVETVTTTVTPIILEAYLYNAALNRTQLDAGTWNFNIYCGTSSANNSPQIDKNIYRVIQGVGTLVLTNSGTTRTATASTGTPFVAGDGTADVSTCGYLQTPNGFFPILTGAVGGNAKVAAVTTLNGYTNEGTGTPIPAGNWKVWKKLFGVNTGNITFISPTYGLVAKQSVQAVHALTADGSDMLGEVVFARAANTGRVISYVHNGETQASNFQTPLVTLHNYLAGLNLGDYQHLTAANHTGLTGGGTTTLHTHTIPVPTSITVAVEATDTSSFPLLVTAGTGDLPPKTSTGWGLSTAHAYTGTGTATSGLPRMFLGTNAPSGDDSALLICRAIAGTDLFSHAVRDESTFTSLTTGAYASFDSIPVLNGDITYNHIASFQSRHQYAGGGTLTDSVGFSYALTTSGAVTASTAFRVYDYAGAGAVTNFYALYIPTLTKPTNHWTIYSTGTSKAYHAGNFGIGTTNPLSPLSVSGDTAAPTVFQDGNNGQVTISSPSGVGTVTKLTFSTPTYGGTGGNAGIGVKWTAGGTEMMFGTSNTYTGISNTAMLISPAGLVGIGGVISASSLLNVSRNLTNSYGFTSRVFCETTLTSDNALYNIALEVDTSVTNVTASKVDTGFKVGVRVLATPTGASFAGTQASMMGFMAYTGIGASATSGAALTNAYGGYFVNYNLTAGTTLTNSYGVYIDSRNSAIGTITNAWDVYASSATAYNYFAGNVGIGVTDPSYSLSSSGNINLGIGADPSYLLLGDFGNNKSSGSVGAYFTAAACPSVYIASNVYYNGSFVNGSAGFNSSLWLVQNGNQYWYTQVAGGTAPGTLKMALSLAGGLSLGNSYGLVDPGAGNMIMTGSLGVGTSDFDGTPATGRLVVQGAALDNTANIFVGRNSNGANVTTLDCAGLLGTTALNIAGSFNYLGVVSIFLDPTNANTSKDEFVLGYSGYPAEACLNISHTQRTNYLFPIIGRNLSGTYGSDAYRVTATTGAGTSGYDGIEFRYGTGVYFYAATGTFTKDDPVTPVPRMIIASSTGIVSIPSGITLGLDAATNTAGYIKMFAAGANAYYNTFTSGENTANATYTLPVAMPPSDGYVLSCTDDGVMSWAAAPAAATMTVVADTTDQTCYPLFVNGATGDLAVKTHAAFGFDALNGWLGVGTATPQCKLEVQSYVEDGNSYGAIIGCRSYTTTDATRYHLGLMVSMAGTYIAASKTDSGQRIALSIAAASTSSYFEGTLNTFMGVQSNAGIGAGVSAGAVVTNAYGGYFTCTNAAATTTVTNAYGLYVHSKAAAVGTITNAWDIYAASATSYNYFAGSVGVGIITPAAKLHILKQTADAALPALYISGKSLYGTGDDDYGFAYYLGYNLTSNRQLIIVDTQSNYGLRFISNYIDGFNKTTMDRMDLNLGSDSNGAHVGTPLANTQFSASNYNGTATKIVCEILGANAQSGNFLNISSFATPNTGDILSVASTGNMFLGTTDVDGTPAIGRLVVKGSTNDGTTNIVVGRDSDGANVATLDTDGNLVLVPFSGITRTGKLDVNNTNSSLVVIRGVSATWQATAVDISKLEFSSWVLDSGSVTSGRISTRLNDPGNTFASDMLLWATPVAGTPVEYIRIKSTGETLIYNGITLGAYGATNTVGTLKLWSSGSSNAYYNTFTSGVNTATAAYTLPLAPPTVNGQLMSCTTAGVLSWAVAPTKTIILPAAAAALGTTTPATRETREIAGNLQVIDVLKFAHASVCIAWWSFLLPDSYDGGVIDAKITYMDTVNDEGTANYLFSLSAGCVADTQQLSVAMGTVQELVTPEGDTANDLRIGAWSTGVTPSGTPAGGKLLFVKLQRDPGDTDHDTSACDVYVLGLRLEYTVNSWSD